MKSTDLSPRTTAEDMPNDDIALSFDEDPRPAVDSGPVCDFDAIALEFDAPVEASDEAFVEAAAEPEFDIAEALSAIPPAGSTARSDSASETPPLDDFEFDDLTFDADDGGSEVGHRPSGAEATDPATSAAQAGRDVHAAVAAEALALDDFEIDPDDADGALSSPESPAVDADEDRAPVPPPREEAPEGTPAGTASAPLSGMVAEMLALLVEELPSVRSTVDESLARIVTSAAGPSVRDEALRECSAALHRFAEAADAGGFSGIRAVFAHLEANLATLAAPSSTDSDVAGLIGSCLARVAAHLDAPSSAPAIGALASACAARAWPVPAPFAEHALARELGGVATMKVAHDAPARAERASAEDVSLALPEDVNRELLDGLLVELPGHTEAFTAAIQRLSAGGTLDDVVAAQRIAHTLKGAGNTVGVRGVAVLTHTLEDILLALSKNARLPWPSLVDGLVTAADCLEAMSESLVSGSPPPEDSVDVLQLVLDWANRIDREGLPDAGMSAPASAPTGQGAAPAAEAGAAARAEGKPEDIAVVPTIRLPATVVDDLLRLVGETIIMTGQIRERLVRAQQQTHSMRRQFELLRHLGADLGEFVDVTDFGAHHALASADAEFDALEMDRYSELHTYGRRMVEAATDASEMGGELLGQFGTLREMLQGQERLNRETQEAVMRTRMVPVKEMFPRLQRSVRQTCRLTGKHAELVLAGGDTLVDSEVLSTVIDALMHLLRNAVDHGIEAPPERAAAGKPETGTVRLEFSRQGNLIVARCEDDGAGLDYAAIYATALRHGLVDPAAAVSQDVLKRFVMQPNFSTRSSATQTSGRGIGLEAVHACVAAMGGAIQLDSRTGQGCSVELRIPVSLISSHALLVKAGDRTIAVSERGIRQVVHPSAGTLERERGSLRFRVGDETYPVHALERLLGALPHTDGVGERSRPMLVVSHADGVCAIEVDAVLETRDLVVKPFGRYVGKLRGMLGATILGDGGVTPVLDLPELLRVPPSGMDATQTTLRGLSLSARKLPVAMVVDDSLSARRSLEQFMCDAGFDVRTARDGVEAVELLAGVRPDILLVDLEMPRMNGMELAAHVRATASLATVPIIMVTSRSTEKHRREAETAGVNVYMSKPFSEDVLLDHLRTLVGL